MLKICPYHHYNLLKIKQWLDEQSAYGWELENWGIFFVKFKESTGGEHFTYQIDMDDTTEEPGMFRREELSKSGWEYVGTIGNTREHIYRNADKKARMPRNESYIAFNQKKLSSELFWSMLLALFMIGLVLFLYVLKNEFRLLTFMQQSVERLLFYAVWMFLMLYQLFGELYQNVKLYRYLERGTEETEKEYDRVERGYGFYFPARILAWMLLVFSIVAAFRVDDRQDFENLSEAVSTLKYVDLADLEGEGFEFSDISWEDYPDVNFGNRIEYIDAPFVNTYYEINQYGKINSNGESIQLEGLYWDVKSEKTAEKLFAQVVECYTKYSYGYSGGLRNNKYNTQENWIKTEISDERFTELIAAEGVGYRFEGDKQVFVRIKNRIICLRYYGETDVNEIVEAIAKEFTSYPEK